MLKPMKWFEINTHWNETIWVNMYLTIEEIEDIILEHELPF